MYNAIIGLKIKGELSSDAEDDDTDTNIHEEHTEIFDYLSDQPQWF